MCGRQACTLAPDQVSNSCKYRDKNGSVRHPQWLDLPGNSRKYQPSPNIGPKTVTPILISSKKAPKTGRDGVENDESKQERALCEMQWGLIPSWHKGSVEAFKFNMINCRSDTLLEKASFRGPLEKGQRCVVLAEGFFEWKTSKDGKKQPYFIHFKDESKEIEDKLKGSKIIAKGGMDSNENKSFTEDQLKTGRKTTEGQNIDGNQSGTESPTEKKLVTMAALYDTWKAPDGAAPLYTYTIITVNSSTSMSWLHERMPAILETDEQVRLWLDSDEMSQREALGLLKPVNCLQWYPVSPVVNNVRNKSPGCMQEIDLTAQKVPKSSNLMGWLKKSPNKHEREISDGMPVEKKGKLEKH